jgi:transposase
LFSFYTYPQVAYFSRNTRLSFAEIHMEGDLKEYYERKVGAGKRKMSVLNAVRNKLVHRIMAVMDRGTAYKEVHEKIG